MRRSLYDELHVTPDAPPEVVEAAHRALVRLYHPDRAGAQSTPRMAAINAARDALADPARRTAYDRMLSASRPSSAIVMPWGRYRDRPLEDVPADYLLWVLHEADAASEGLRADVRAVLRARGVS